jgi:hypothetical protein
MTRTHVNRIGMVAPVLCSILALGLVVANLLAGVQPQEDEGAAAHLFQLLIVLQLPLGLIFIATADWSRPLRAMIVLAVQASALAAAFAALWLSGFELGETARADGQATIRASPFDSCSAPLRRLWASGQARVMTSLLSGRSFAVPLSRST